MSLRNAVNQMCKHCIYDDASPGNWRQQVTACTSPKCPLFPHKPTSKPHNANRAKSCDSGDKSAHQSSTPVIITSL